MKTKDKRIEKKNVGIQKTKEKKIGWKPCYNQERFHTVPS